jgi:hypothetical protein
MEINLSSLPSEELRIMYYKAYAELKKELLNGASWPDVKKLIDLSIGLSIELCKRVYSVSIQIYQMLICT